MGRRCTINTAIAVTMLSVLARSSAVDHQQRVDVRGRPEAPETEDLRGRMHLSGRLLRHEYAGDPADELLYRRPIERLEGCWGPGQSAFRLTPFVGGRQA